MNIKYEKEGAAGFFKNTMKKFQKDNVNEIHKKILEIFRDYSNSPDETGKN